jgi:hypothetical protein
MSELTTFLLANDKLVTAWTAIAALLISSLSIILGVANLVMQRRHNRKGVHPIGHISVGDYENQIFVRLRNDGVGPMIVKNVVVRNRENGEKRDAIIDFMPTPLPGNYQWTTFIREMQGRAISANDHLTLVLLEGEVQDQRFVSSRQIFRKLASILNIEVTYENIYGEQMAPASRDLDWFGRRL